MIRTTIRCEKDTSERGAFLVKLHIKKTKKAKNNTFPLGIELKMQTDICKEIISRIRQGTWI